VPAIDVFAMIDAEDVDGRNKCGRNG
jgi:hypothetical protein